MEGLEGELPERPYHYIVHIQTVKWSTKEGAGRRPEMSKNCPHGLWNPLSRNMSSYAKNQLYTVDYGLEG